MKRFAIATMMCAATFGADASNKPFAFHSVRFEANRGQTDPAVRYIARTRGQQIFFTDSGVVFSPPTGPAISMKFAGAARPQWTPAGPAIDNISYFLGRDPAKWVKAAPVYDRITWRGLYRGIDVTFYAAGDRLEYDILVAPGADPSQVRVQFDGTTRATGQQLEISRGQTTIRQRVPAIYQETPSGRRRNIAGAFDREGQTGARLRVANYDASTSLVVDPVIEMATYIGGENDDEIVAIADGFVAGNTRSLAFPPAQPALRNSRDVFLRGTGPVIPGQSLRTTFYGIYVFGGSGDEDLAGIAIRSSLGYVTLAGTTTSRDFPGTGTSKYNGGASDGFVANLIVSTDYASLSGVRYLGGSGEDRITAFRGDELTHAAAGITDSPDFPVTGDVAQKTLAGGKDGFYAIGDASSPFRYCGYIGGSGDDDAYAISMRNSGSVWIGGETRSSDFPFATASPLAGPSDGFLAEIRLFTTAGNAATEVTSYRIGGDGEDRIAALAASPSSLTASLGASSVVRPFTVPDIGFAGTTTSANLFAGNAAFPAFGGERDGFAGSWDTARAVPRWLTYLGGAGPDEIAALTMNWAGDLYAAGWTSSTNLAVVDPLQAASAGGEDGMFAVFDSTGAVQQFTYYGGSGNDRIRDVRLIYGSVARLAGSTTSPDLPELGVTQLRGAAADGFLVDLGSDFLIGPTELIVAKDGVLSFSVRPARTAYRNAVTYRSSDPTRIRLVHLGRSYDEVTAAPEDNIAVEALADSGQALITVTAPGWRPKQIVVRLYPGAFFPSSPTGDFLTTWTAPVALYAYYRALDPNTGQMAGTSAMGIRAGARLPVLKWSVSDPSIFEILDLGGSYQLRVLRAGQATLNLSVDGYSVMGADRSFAVVQPRPVAPAQGVRIGRDLFTNLPLNFSANGSFFYNGYRGTLTARSSDPARLLLSLDGDQVGRETVTRTMSGQAPTIWAQALAAEGTVDVVLTSSEFDGEIVMPVTLEPAVVRYGVSRYVAELGRSVLDPVVSLTTGVQATQLVLRLEGESGSSASGYRPGAPELTFALSNSNPKVLELDRLTQPMLNTGAAYTLYGLAAGVADLRLTTSRPDLPPAYESVRVEVVAQASGAQAASLPATVHVGKGLQTWISFRYQPQQTVEIVSENPDAVLVSSSTQMRGAARLSLTTQGSSDTYPFIVQGLAGAGESLLRLRFPTGEERQIRVVSLPSGAGFSSWSGGSPAQGYSRSIRVLPWALDPATGIGVFLQSLQPGVKMELKFRSEGAAVRLSHQSATLASDSGELSLSYTLPAAGEQATLFVESDAEAVVSPVTSTLLVKQAPVAPSSSTMLLARGEMRELDISSYASRPALTVTSSDPDRVLISTSPTAPPSPSPSPADLRSRIYIHALAGSGNATVSVNSAGVPLLILQVALQPLQLRSYGGAALTVGATTEYTLSLNAYQLRPNSGPYKWNVRVADTRIAAVDPQSFELGGSDGATSTKLRVSGLATGATRLDFDGPPEVVANSASVSVGAVALSLPEHSLGKNLQASLQFDLGAGFANPNGAILTLTSSAPERLLLSRAASAPGAASLSVTVPAGSRSTQPVYLQALDQGDATVNLTSGATPRALATVHVKPSWVSCGADQAVVNLGATLTRYCWIAYPTVSPSTLSEIRPRAGLGELSLSVESTTPELFSVSPQTLSLNSMSATLTLQGLAPGSGELRLTPPPEFGSAPDGSDRVPVTVVLPRLDTFLPTALYLGKDTQYKASLPLPKGAVITATSLDPSLLLVSADEKLPGAATASATSGGSYATLTLQALTSYGTVEVVFTAPGYQDARIAIRLRPTEVYWGNLPYGGLPVQLKVGATSTLFLDLRANIALTPRAGSNVAIDLLTDRPGIVAFEPARVILSPDSTRTEVKLKGVAPGTVLLRLGVPDGLTAPTTPVMVTVVP